MHDLPSGESRPFSRRRLLRLASAGATVLALGACAEGTRGPAGVTPQTGAAPASRAASTGSGAAGRYPTRPVDFIVPWGAGGGADQMARTIGPLVEASLGVALPVQNVPGATGGTGMAKLLAAPADGQTILLYIADSHAVVASDEATWKTEDLSPIVRLMKAPSFVFVRADDARFQAWQDFERLARERPNALKVATLGRNSVDELSLTYLMKQGGYQINLVPYANPGERYNSVISSQVDALYEQAGDVGQYLANKQIRPVLIFNEERMAQFPDTPTSKELGYDIFLPQFRGIVVRAGTDPAIVQLLAEHFEAAAKSPEWARFAESQYVTPDSYLGPEAFGQSLRADLDVMTQIKKQYGL
ncbi:MAG TPA: tripartite tricarboxylate transporter substrate binding protein [Chloroflexota bacterium]|nr:tripartite tricarboxylate transporter substrate binding protein [Chloroflexota bacterium]